MPTAQQRSDLRADIGDNGTTPIFDDPAIDRLFTRAEAKYTDADSIEAATRVFAITQMLGDAAKLRDYKQNQSSDSMSQVFKHLQELLKLWQGVLSDAVSATRGGGVAWGSIKKVPSRKYEMPDS